jgi:hypothetical protein
MERNGVKRNNEGERNPNEGVMERNGVKRNNEGERNPNEGVMERNGVKRNNEGERTRVRKSGAPSDSVATARNAFLRRNQYTSHTLPTST